MTRRAGTLVSVLLWVGATACPGQESSLRVPRLAVRPVIDGNLEDWRERSFSDGLWTMERLRGTPWFDAERNRLTLHAGESSLEPDLAASYYLAWDEEYLYLGAEVHDNENDVLDPDHAPERWYYKDCVCWFIEAPRDDRAERFSQGGNAFCFVIDASRPDYAAWWRHGSPTQTYIEEPLPADAVDYAIRMDPWERSPSDFVLEARVRMAATLGVSDPNWQAPAEGDVYGVEIVHTDPDGGDYGGHFLVYGRGDDDSTWGEMVLAGVGQGTAVARSSWALVKTLRSGEPPTAP